MRNSPGPKHVGVPKVLVPGVDAADETLWFTVELSPADQKRTSGAFIVLVVYIPSRRRGIDPICDVVPISMKLMIGRPLRSTLKLRCHLKVCRTVRWLQFRRSR
jgi:hypothetical protein